MSSSNSVRIRFLIFLLVTVLLNTACSSSNSNSSNAQTPADSAPNPVQASLEVVQDKTFLINWQPSEGADYYRVLENPDGVSGFEPISNEIATSVQNFGHRVALYSRLNALYIVQACNTAGCTDSDEQIVSGSLDQAIGYFKASNTEGGSLDFTLPGVLQGDRFGSALSLSGDGKTLAISAPGEDSSATGVNGDEADNAAENSGAVYVFVHSNGRWQQQAYLKASNTDEFDNFGGNALGFSSGFSNAISLSDDGNTLAIGAFREQSAATGIDGDQSDNSAADAELSGAGAVYVFVRSGGDWQQQSYVKASNTFTPAGFEKGDQFGRYLSLSGDGRTLAVGASGEDSSATGINGEQNDESALDSGAAYVFVRSDNSWVQQAYIKAANVDGTQRLGGDLSLSSNGNTLAVGGADAGTPSFSNIGAVYVFERSNSNWRQQAYLQASNAGEGDFFGHFAVSVSGDGHTLAVGARGEDSAATGVNGDQNDNSIDSAGAVYVFDRSNGNWQQQAYLKASNTQKIAQFGSSVSLNEDGSTLAVGAFGEASIATGINGDQTSNVKSYLGAAYVFMRSNANWQQKAYLKSSNRDPADSEDLQFSESFGHAVSLSADGNTLAIGADEESSAATGVNGDQNDRSAPGAGAVYLY